MKKNLGGIPAAWVFHVLIELLLIHFSVSIMPKNNGSNKVPTPYCLRVAIPFFLKSKFPNQVKSKRTQVKWGEMRSNTLSDFGTGHLRKKSAESKSLDHKILCIYEKSDFRKCFLVSDHPQVSPIPYIQRPQSPVLKASRTWSIIFIIIMETLPYST